MSSAGHAEITILRPILASVSTSYLFMEGMLVRLMFAALADVVFSQGPSPEASEAFVCWRRIDQITSPTAVKYTKMTLGRSLWHILVQIVLSFVSSRP